MKGLSTIGRSAPQDVADDVLVDVTGLVAGYGSSVVLDGVDLRIRRGERVALIGPNGAGKTTLVNVLAGLLKPRSGEITVRGVAGYVPEGRHLFPDLSVADNLRLGAWRGADRDPSRVLDLLPALRPLARRSAGALSGGQQQLVAIGRALMADPELLVVDELSLGLAPLVVAELAGHLAELCGENKAALLLIDQNVALASDLCDWGHVLENGRIRMSGSAQALASDPEVRVAYFGELGERE